MKKNPLCTRWAARCMVVFGLVSVLPLAAYGAEPVSELIQRIKNYEALFDHVHAQFTMPKMEKVDGHWVAVSNPVSKVDIVVDGDRIRRTEDAIAEGSSVLSRTVTVTDGKRVQELRTSSSGSNAHVAFYPFDAAQKGLVGLPCFDLHSNVDAVKQSNIRIVADTPSYVTLVYEARLETRLVAKYERFGEYLRPLSYRPYYTNPLTGETQELTYFLFTYPRWTKPTLDVAAPKTVAQICEARRSCVRIDFINVTFNPKVNDAEFDLRIPKGTLVVDRF